MNIGSGCNKLAFPKLVAYTASKGGIEMLTKVSALELGPYGIRVNCVAPGAIEIERTKLETANYADTWGRLAPLGRVGTPQDVGQMIVFLASNESSFVTGQTIWVDGGVFSQAPWIAERVDTATLAVDCRCTLGEAVAWCERRGALPRTDIEGARLRMHVHCQTPQVGPGSRH